MDYMELNQILTGIYKVGYMEAVKAYDPPQDKLRLSEVKRWLRFMKISLKDFNRKKKESLINTYRDGKCGNSPLFYSKAEIMKAFSIGDVASMMVKDGIAQECRQNR